jgi:hypothetical protein
MQFTCLDLLDFVSVIRAYFALSITVCIVPTSYDDPAKRARSLAEQILCLKKQNNDLEFKYELLFENLF